MKGMVFNELERMVVAAAGEDLWEEILETTPLETPEGVFLGPQSYPDSEFVAIVVATGKALKTPLEQLVPAFGRYLFPRLAERFPIFLRPEMTAKSFLVTVEATIHLEVRKLYPDAGLPRFDFVDPAADRLEITYASPRRLCALVAGMIDGVAEHFHEEVQVEHDRCVHRGDEVCHFELRFRPGKRPTP
ncbi:MAG: heme NO-binding domain-containing protein [Proteobacteria bacterium]|nr:heme NO-binding domain-containing protein [Pseudomonadota bacterium]